MLKKDKVIYMKPLRHNIANQLTKKGRGNERGEKKRERRRREKKVGESRGGERSLGERRGEKGRGMKGEKGRREKGNWCVYKGTWWYGNLSSPLLSLPLYSSPLGSPHSMEMPSSGKPG